MVYSNEVVRVFWRVEGASLSVMKHGGVQLVADFRFVKDGDIFLGFVSFLVETIVHFKQLSNRTISFSCPSIFTSRRMDYVNGVLVASLS